MWKVVYVISTEKKALELEKELGKQGFLIEIEPGEEDFQIKTPESEADEVYDFIINFLG